MLDTPVFVCYNTLKYLEVLMQYISFFREGLL